MVNPVLLIDGNNLSHRNYHAQNLSTSTGVPTGLTFGFLQSLLYVVANVRPRGMVCVWDERTSKEHRRTLFPGYKAHRDTTEIADDFYMQVDTLRLLLGALGIQCVSSPDCEADDIIGYYAKRLNKMQTDCCVYSNDADLYQLITPSNADYCTLVFHPKDGIMTGTQVRNNPKFGVWPRHIVDFKALAGDSSDEYKGVPGVGPKNAAQIINTIDGLDCLFTDPPTKIGMLGAKHAALLLMHREDIRVCRELARLHTERCGNLNAVHGSRDMGYVQEVFQHLEFNEFLERRWHEFKNLPEGGFPDV